METKRSNKNVLPTAFPPLIRECPWRGSFHFSRSVPEAVASAWGAPDPECAQVPTSLEVGCSQAHQMEIVHANCQNERFKQRESFGRNGPPLACGRPIAFSCLGSWEEGGSEMVLAVPSHTFGEREWRCFVFQTIPSHSPIITVRLLKTCDDQLLTEGLNATFYGEISATRQAGVSFF